MRLKPAACEGRSRRAGPLQVARSGSFDLKSSVWEQALQSAETAEAMRYDGVRPETIVGIVEGIAGSPYLIGPGARPIIVVQPEESTTWRMEWYTASRVVPRTSTVFPSQLHPSDGSLPDGQVLHVAGATDDGWIIVAIHDSQQSWEQFRDGILMPRMQEGIEGGFQGPPKETTFGVRNHVSG